MVLWRLRYRLTLRDLSEMFLMRGIVFSYEPVLFTTTPGESLQTQLAQGSGGQMRGTAATIRRCAVSC